MKLLIVSVGSMVGQNILDALDCPHFNRRKYVTVVGTNSLVNSVNNFRCDKCYLVPNTASPEFEDSIINLIKEIKPDLILCARDEDTEALWKIMNQNPDIHGKLPYGNLHSIMFALDKWQSWKFTQKHNLPFAETFLLEKECDIKDLKQFCNKVEYPMIAKPARGFASKGVFFVRCWEDVLKALDFDGYILQEYLGNPETIDSYFKSFDNDLTPLFSHAPDTIHYSCCTVLSPNSTISPILITRNVHNSGKPVESRKVRNDELEKLTKAYARAFHAEGGAGPISIQARQNRYGTWKIQEINMRPNGSTYTRMLMGQDELALIMNAFLPEFNFPEYRPPTEHENALYFKTLVPQPLTIEQLESLTIYKNWTSQPNIQAVTGKQIISPIEHHS